MAGSRQHVIVVPGFAGFDALGQLEYYGGLTPLFDRREDAVLHYFDNFPTASVATRAGRLRAFLAKRITRGEIAPRDEVTLIGHSTGGLDIRALLWSLRRARDTVEVDGGAEVRPAAILDAVRRVVFLSVPHWGTNIADWVRSYPFWRDFVVSHLRAASMTSQWLFLSVLAPAASGIAASWARSGLFRAIQDALREADPRCARGGPCRLAEAHEADSQLDLYLRHIATDFGAIDDLTAAPPRDGNGSPAHFTPRQRRDEERFWREQGIDARSYVTIGPRPFAFEPDRPAPVWDLTRPWTGADILRPVHKGVRADIVYRVCYRACAGGPFRPPPESAVLGPLESWDNDGIVNTASMLWPLGEHRLVEADHMDIVGHFLLASGPPGCARRYRSYDLLGSASGFKAESFAAIWREIFAWSTQRAAVTASSVGL